MRNMVDRFLNSENIVENLHERTFDFYGFNLLTSKIKLEQFNDIRNRIYWLSYIIYKICILNTVDDIKPGNELRLRKNDFIVFNPFMCICSEICRLLKSNYLYTPLTSVLARSMIAQVCLIEKIEEEKIEDHIVIRTSIVCHNKHVGAEKIEVENLNYNNPGLFKVFKENIKLQKVANIYGYGWLYRFYSGDIHATSTIEKLMPKLSKNINKYDDAYMQVFLSLLFKCFKVVVNFDEVSKEFSEDDFSNFEFLEI